MKKGILISLILAASFVVMVFLFPTICFLFVISNSDDCMEKGDIIEYVTENQAEIEAAAADFMAIPHEDINRDIKNMNIPPCSGIKDITYDDRIFGKPIIIFYCGGYGIVPSGGSVGFKYALFDDALIEDKTAGTANLSGLGYSISKFIPRGNGWYWKQGDGDNTVYIENIIGNFYYYKETY